MANILEVRKLVKKYKKVKALKGVDFDVKEGEIFALVGPNGAGKSTTLRILATVLSLTSGSVKVKDYDIDRDQDKIRKIISYLPEEAGAYKNLSGKAYLDFMASIFIDDRQQRRKGVEYAIEIAGLKDRLKDKVKTYSKGMTRKLLLARTIMSKPQLSILDEPTSGLDVINALEVRKIIRGLVNDGTSIILSSHNMLEVEFLADRVAIINEGRIVASGTTNELKKKFKAKNLEEVFMAAV